MVQIVERGFQVSFGHAPCILIQVIIAEEESAEVNAYETRSKTLPSALALTSTSSTELKRNSGKN